MSSSQPFTKLADDPGGGSGSGEDEAVAAVSSARGTGGSGAMREDLLTLTPSSHASIGKLAAVGDVPAASQGRGATARMTVYMVVLTAVSAVGGLLFGYDTGVVSGAVLVLKDDFHLSDFQVEIFVSATIAAAIVGAAVAGRLANSRGRRPLIILSSAVFVAGAACMAFARTFSILLVGRVVVGLAIGLSSMVAPVYIAECSAPEFRGLLVTINNLFITGGQFLSTCVDGGFADVPDGWRYMLGLSAVPATIQLVGMLYLPESPRFLVSTGDAEQAAMVLSKTRGVAVRSGAVVLEIERIKAATATRSLPFRDAIAIPSVRRALILGCMLQALQQSLGINTVMYYSGTILTLAGIRDRSLAIWLAAVVAFTNFAFTIVGVVMVERVGRKKLTLGSIAGIIVALVVLGVAFFISQQDSAPVSELSVSAACASASTCGQCAVIGGCGYCAPSAAVGAHGLCLPGNDDGPTGAAASYCNTTVTAADSAPWILNGCPRSAIAWVALGSLIGYLAAFAPGMGPMPWTVNAEIFPLSVRGPCVGVTTSVNWTLNFLVSVSFLSLARAVTIYGVFWLYAAVGVAGFLWLWRYMPETKGKSLEDIAKLFRKPGDAVAVLGTDAIPAPSDAPASDRRNRYGSRATHQREGGL